jgi:CRISPR system Cascade subunit CasE
MSESWHLSRVRLRQNPSVRALARLLLPADEDARIGAGHRLVWSLFAGDPDRRRDFLWHEEEPGCFLVFSPERPDEAHALLEVEMRRFAHWPQAGERFAFHLRANPTASKAGGRDADGKRRRGRRDDVVMQALYPVPGRKQTGEPLCNGEGRAFLRDSLLGWLPDGQGADPRRPIHAWLATQGVGAGFTLDDLRVDAYRRVRLAREPSRADALVFGQADLSGVLTVTDAPAFAARLKAGFGRAKAFGCGLMLLARLDEAGEGKR